MFTGEPQPRSLPRVSAARPEAGAASDVLLRCTCCVTEMNITAGEGVAVREFKLESTQAL